MGEWANGVTRRGFLERAAGAAAVIGGAAMLPAHAQPSVTRRAVAPSDRLIIALIGCGGMGGANLDKFMAKPEIEIAALCDVDSAHLASRASVVTNITGRKPLTFKDYRRVLERKDIDAVLICTPDHWHAMPLIHACEAGKDAYCEKPISHNIMEARSMANAVKRFGRIVQVGTWQRSKPEFNSAISYVRAGKLGTVTQVRTWKTDSATVGRLQPGKVPTVLDYDFWQGPAAAEPYREKAVHFNWRWFLNYGSGMTGDWGVHMMDIGLLGMSKDTNLVMPNEVTAYGGKWAFPADDRTAPDTVVALMRFHNPEFVMQWETQRSHAARPDSGVEFIGDDGRSVIVWRGGWLVQDAEGKEMPKDEAEAPSDHWQNWIDCVKTRQQPRSNLASVAQTTIVCHLINAAVGCGETVRWNRSQNDLVGTAGKNTLSYARAYRQPWTLPIY